MKRFFYIAIVLLLAMQGCKKRPVPAPVGALTIENGVSDVRLNHRADNSVTLNFTAKSDWNITLSGSSFDVSPVKGDGSDEMQSVTIRATEENAGNEMLQMGSFTIRLNGYSNQQSIKVLQYPISSRTYIAYLFGTSLSYYLNNNVECMRKALDSDILQGGRLLLFAQKSRNKGQIKEIYYDEQTKGGVVRVIAEIDLPETLTDEIFAEHLRKIMDIAPAKSYAMIVGGHSTAWLPQTPSSGGTPLSLGGYIPDWTPASGGEVTRTIGEKNMRLGIDEFASGLSLTGKHFDWIYFDVCFMSSMEASYALREHTDYTIGSPCEIMGYGSPYDLMMRAMIADDLNEVCRIYRDFYEYDYYGSQSGCIATIVSAELDNLAVITKELNQQSIDSEFDILGVQTYEGRSSHVFFDFEDFAIKAYGEDNDVVKALRAQLDKTVVNRFHTAKFYSTYNAQMNNIAHFSGVNFTPEDSSLAMIKAEADALDAKTTELSQELAALEAELKASGIEPSSSERYNSLKGQITTVAQRAEHLLMQYQELVYYLPMLQNTEWYKATH